MRSIFHYSMNQNKVKITKCEMNIQLLNIEASRNIFILDIDSFKHLFDWLSLSDLKILRQTCKQLKNIIDCHIKSHYPIVRIGYVKIEHFRNIEPNIRNLIREVRLLNYYQKFDEVFQENKEILNHVEYVRSFKNCVSGEFYETFLKFCPNLKCVSIGRVRDDIIIGSTNEWLLRSYPTLKHLKLLDFLEPEGHGIVELKPFFELNPNIQTFSTTLQFLKANAKCLIGTKSKLDQLCINITSEHYNLIDDVIDLLNELHRHGFFQCLYLYIGCLCTIDNINRTELISMPALEKIRLPSCEQLILPTLPELKELKIDIAKKSTNWEALSKPLMNVERVYIENGTIADIEPFICHFKKLQHIKIGFYLSWKSESTLQTAEGRNQEKFYSSYLSALNEERKKLTGACKTTIYIDEKIFLAMKWSSSLDNFDLVEFKRSEAFEWKNQCWYELNDGEDKLKYCIGPNLI